MDCRPAIYFLLWAVATAACGGAAPCDTGLEALVRVVGGQFYRGSIDKLATGNAPAVVDVLNSQNVITAGLQNKQLSGRLDPGSTAVAIGFADDVGYWILPADVPDADSPTQPTFHASLSFSPSLPQTVYDLIVRAVSPPNVFGPAAHVSLDAEPSLPPTGALVVSLWWDTEADLDLHVVDPYGVEIWAGNINSYDRYATIPAPDAGVLNEDGILDFDSNSGCVIDGRCNENVIWSVAAPAGDYVVRVDTFSLCGNPAARWTVEALFNGTSLGKAEGEALPSSQRFSKGKGSGLEALSFTVPSP
jgi:hypothetical protein